MSLIEQFPQLGAESGGGGSWNGGNVTNPATFSGGIAAASALTIGETLVIDTTSLALNGGTQTFVITDGALVVVTGSTASSTIDLPNAAGNTGAIVILLNEATVNWTLGASGGNIDGAATQTIKANSIATIYASDGTNWYSLAPGQSFNDARYMQLGATNSPSGRNSFSGEVDLEGVATFSSQAIVLSGTTPTIANGPALVRITGSTASTTVDLPSSPVTNQILLIDNQATVAFTLSGNGNNIDGAASKTVAAGPLILWFSGSVWESVAWTQYNLDSRYPQKGASNTWAAGFAQTFSGYFVVSRQTFSGSGTISNASGMFVALTGTSGGTIDLPSSSLQTGQFVWIKDEGGNAGTSNWVISGNGKNIDGASSITLAKNYAGVLVTYNGSAWDLVNAYQFP